MPQPLAVTDCRHRTRSRTSLTKAGSLLGASTSAGKNSEPSGEFDVKIKHGKLRKPGQSLEDAIFAEKLREDSLRDLGWQIVRWIWADLYRRGVIRDRVLRAFARALS